MLDAYADKEFVDPPMEQLKDNGEIPAAYYHVNHTRDNFVNGLRVMALIQQRSADVAVGSASKRKTALGMLLDVAAKFAAG